MKNTYKDDLILENIYLKETWHHSDTTLPTISSADGHKIQVINIEKMSEKQKQWIHKNLYFRNGNDVKINVNGDGSLHLSSSSQYDKIFLNINEKKMPKYVNFHTIGCTVSLRYHTSLNIKNKLESLENFPKYVYGSFNCSAQNLLTLKGCPHIIPINGVYVFSCFNNTQLKSLSGFLETNNEENYKEQIRFYCGLCPKLKNLKGSPKICAEFNCEDNTGLTTLDGCPEFVDCFNCTGCTSLENLEYAPSECNLFSCKDCTKLNIRTKFPTDKDGYVSTIGKFVENHFRKMVPTYKEFGEEGSSLF